MPEKMKLTISTRPKIREVFSRKLVHSDAQLNIEIKAIASVRFQIDVYSSLTG